jgi:DNA-binding CsgD family transcriptional regulator
MVSLNSQNLFDVREASILASEATSMDTLRKQVVNLVHKSFKSTSTIFWLTNKDNTLIDPVMLDIQNQFLLPYKNHFFKQNPFDPLNLSILKRPSYIMEQLIPVSDFHKTEYYNDFLKPQNIHRQMAIYIRKGNKLKGVLGMHRSFKKSFGKKFLFMGDIIAGQLTAAFERLSLIEEINKNKSFQKMICESKSIGIIILDETRHCIFSNIKAEQICSRLAQRYAPVDSSINTKCLIPDIIIEDCQKDLSLPLLFKERVLSINSLENYRVKCQSIDKNISGNNKELFMITLEDDHSPPHVNAIFLKERFGLTKREIEIISYIYKGFTNLEIANTLFISEGTVKNHLKHIFAKTSASNRTHLIHKAILNK